MKHSNQEAVSVKKQECTEWSWKEMHEVIITYKLHSLYEWRLYVIVDVGVE